MIETRVEVWENKKGCVNTSRKRVFPQLFQIFPNFHKCFYLTIRLQARVFFEQIVNEAQPRWLSLIENEGE